MPDHTDNPFSAFNPEVPMPLSAADVRRRGDRLRRRNAALAVVGGVAAVALIATPLALFAGGDDSQGSLPLTSQTGTVTDPAPTTAPNPSPTEPSDEATTTSVLIPDGFPLDDRLPATNDVDGTPVVVTDQPAITKLEPCGSTVWTPAAAVDTAGASFNGFEDTRTRTLVLYSSEGEAAAALQALRVGFADCPVDDMGGTEQVYEEVSSAENESVFTHRYRGEQGFDPGLEVLQFNVENNALLIATYYGEGGGSDETIASSVDLANTESAGVYTAMTDAFGAGGTTITGSGDVPLSGVDVVGLGDLPQRDRLGEWREVEPDDAALDCYPDGFAVASLQTSYEAGDAAAPDGTAIGRVSSYVYEFDDADSAAGAFADVATALDNCAESRGFTASGTGDATGLGADRAQWQTFTYAAPEVCTDCDGLWFDRMGVAQVDNHLVLLSYAEVGGPIEPDGLDGVMRDLLATAISLA